MEKGLPKETTDHVHQKSAWFCHGDVIPDGLELKVRSSDKNVKGVDFWSEGRGHGTIACVSVGDVRTTGGASSISTKNEWRTADGTKILDEDRTISVRVLGNAPLIVLDIDLHASVCPITFGDTKEGSMGVRVNDQFRLTAPGGDGVVTSAGGSTAKAPAKDNLPMWGKRSDWNDYSGTVDGKLVGIALFDHPKNSPRAAWHTRAYGLMAANPFGRASFPDTKGELTKLAKGDHLKLRYGILLHTGDAKAAKVAELYAAFAKECVRELSAVGHALKMGFAGEVPEWSIGRSRKTFHSFPRGPRKMRQTPRKLGVFALPGGCPKRPKTYRNGRSR
jgi:hypothetical protein